MDVAADNKEDAGEDADEESDGMEYEPALTRPSAATAAAAADAGALPGGAAATAAGGLKPTGEDPSMFDAAATLASLFGGSGSEESDGTASPASSPTRKNAPASGLAPASAPLSHAGANSDGDGDGDGDSDGPPSAKRHKAAAKSPSSSTSSRRRAGAGSHRRTAASSGGSAAASSPAPTPAGSSKRKSAPTAARMSKSPSSSPKRRGPSAKPVLGAKKLNGKNGSAAAPPAPAHAQAPAPASATAAAANTPTQLSSHPPSSPMARSPTTPHPPIGLPQGCIRVTTFQTRSRDETRALQAEAEVLNKRYIPPGRPVFQCFAAPKVPPTAPVDVEDANLYPFIRIGDTVELNFAMKTPFDLMCKGSQIEPNGQTALGFQCTDSKKAAILSLEFQIFYYSFDDGVVCLRCQKAPGACACNYASDLLEINRDWKAKRDPQRRLGLKEHSDGTCSIAIRVPRTRRKVSKADKEAGVQQSDRPNTWNSKLRQLSPKDPKVIAIKMIEKRTLLTGAKTSTTLAEHLSFTRLVAKNGGQLASGTARRGRASVSPTAVARGHDSAGSAKSGSGGAAKNAKARRNCAGTASGGVASVSKGGGNSSSSSSRRRSSSVPPASPVAAVAAGKAKPKSKPKPKPRALPKAVSPAAETPAATQSPMARASVAHDFAHLDAAAAAATAAAITAQAAAAAATAHALRQVAAAADAAKAAAEAAPAGMQPSFALAGSPIRTGVGADGMAALSGYSSSPLALAMSAAMSAAAVATTPPFHHQAAAAGAGAAAAASASAVPAALAALMAHENTPEAVSPARSEGASSSDDGNDGAMSRRNRAKRKLKWASAADSTDST